MFAAARAGVRLFATGGIGGVHRGDALDVSSDMTALGEVKSGFFVVPLMRGQQLKEQAQLDGLLRDGPGVLEGFPADSRLGHMHLTVGDVDRSLDFYKELGMDLTAGFGPFGFLSWERYHHHLGVNLLNGPGAARVEDDVAGLDFFEIARPELQPGTVLDPDGIQLRLTSV